MTALSSQERQLAEAVARLIAKAAEIGLPDDPHKLVSPASIRLLARAHLELRGVLDSVRETSLAKIDLTLARPLDQRALHATLSIDLIRLKFAGCVQVRVQNVFTNIGIRYVGELVQLDKKTLLRQKNLGPRSLRDIERVLASHGLSLGSPVQDWPGPRWKCTSAWPYCEKVPLQLVSKAGQESELTSDPNAALYCRVMGVSLEAFLKHATYIVRQWDGMDGCWTDCTAEVARDEALRIWLGRTNGGTKCIAYAEIDYYRIFPSGTKMLWDGADGQEMHR